MNISYVTLNKKYIKKKEKDNFVTVYWKGLAREAKQIMEQLRNQKKIIINN